jgi:hypothetical protein
VIWFLLKRAEEPACKHWFAGNAGDVATTCVAAWWVKK